jgi:methyl acetate hydrolase
MHSMAAFEKVMKQTIDSGEAPGVVAILSDAHNILYETAYGRRSVAASDAMTPNTIFWSASMTKAVVSAGAMQLVEQGKVQLDEPVGKFLPALVSPQVLQSFADNAAPHLRPAKQPITLRHLLTHTAGFAYDTWNGNMLRYMKENNFLSLLHARKRDLLLPLVGDPGSHWRYGIGIDWAGQLIEAISGLTSRDYLRDNLLGPIGMNDTDFIISPSHRRRLARVHQRRSDGSLEPIEHEVSQTPEFHMGGGGLYGSARDYAAFLRMLLNGGKTSDGTQVLQQTTVDMMGQNHIGELEAGQLKSYVPDASKDINFFPGMSQKWGLSFLINTETAPTGRSAGSLTWAGLANTFFWIDRKEGIGGVFMTQVLPFGDPAILRLYESFERDSYQLTTAQRRQGESAAQS